MAALWSSSALNARTGADELRANSVLEPPECAATEIVVLLAARRQLQLVGKSRLASLERAYPPRELLRSAWRSSNSIRRRRRCAALPTVTMRESGAARTRTERCTPGSGSGPGKRSLNNCHRISADISPC